MANRPSYVGNSVWIICTQSVSGLLILTDHLNLAMCWSRFESLDNRDVTQIFAKDNIYRSELAVAELPTKCEDLSLAHWLPGNQV